MTSIESLLNSIKLTKQKNKDGITYGESFEEAGIETVEDIQENIATKEELVEYINPKPIHLKKILKVLANTYNITIESSNKSQPGQCEEKEKEGQLSTFEKYPERKSYKGDIAVRVLHKVPCQEDVTNGKPIKTILVVGETGTGKTTCLNSMMNYLFDVDFNDKYRFKLIHEDNDKFKVKQEKMESMTDDVSAYYIEPENPELNYNLALVDTPGFGDTRGIEQDKKIVKQIKYFFEKKLDTITGVCFVIKSNTTRLTASQMYIFSQLFSIFGKDIADNIFVLITFCDGAEVCALKALNADDVKCPYKAYFELNNSAFFNKKPNKMTKMFWDMGMEAFEKFFKKLGGTKDKSLTLTKEVLKQREKLVNHVQNLHFKIALGTGRMRALNELEQQLETLSDVIDQCSKFEIKEKRYYSEKVKVPNGVYTTYCTKCHNTCHRECAYGNDSDKRWCSAITNDYCTECEKNCHWEHHNNYKYWIEDREKVVTTTSEELFKKYGKASGEASQTGHFIEKIEEELCGIKLEVLGLIQEVTICNQKLKSQALRHNVVSQKAYVELMIEAEKRDKKDGFIERVNSLESLLESLELIESIQKNKINDNIKNITLFDKETSKSKRQEKSNKVKNSLKKTKQKVQENSNWGSQFSQYAMNKKQEIENRLKKWLG